MKEMENIDWEEILEYDQTPSEYVNSLHRQMLMLPDDVILETLEKTSKNANKEFVDQFKQLLPVFDSLDPENPEFGIFIYLRMLIENNVRPEFLVPIYYHHRYAEELGKYGFNLEDGRLF